MTDPEVRRIRVPRPNTVDVGADEVLATAVREEIRSTGPMTFARIMEIVQYDPERGYYRGDPRPGRGGDFLTAPEAHPIFGRSLARQVRDVWERLGRPDPFVVREYGAGTGALAAALLDGLAAEEPALAALVRYRVVEVEPRRGAAVHARLRNAGLEDRLETDDGAAIDGVVLANEVLDALPFHRVVRRDGRLREVFVDVRDGRLVDIEGDPSTPALAERLAADGVELEDAQAGEICLEVDGWVASAAAGLRRGLLLLIDYGYHAPELYDARRRRSGTLAAYVRHTVHDDPYRHVGRQDLTAHVDLSAVIRAAERDGLDVLGETTQGELLASLDAGDLLRALGEQPDATLPAYLEARAALMRMIDPAAMGRFRALFLGRDLPREPPLLGLTVRVQGRATR